MHDGGEVDIRGVYCALCVAMLTQIFTEELFNNTREWLTAYVPNTYVHILFYRSIGIAQMNY